LLLALLNITRAVEIWDTERLMLYTRAFVMPVVAGVVAGGKMEAAKALLGDYLLPIVGATIGRVLVVVVLYDLRSSWRTWGSSRMFPRSINSGAEIRPLKRVEFEVYSIECTFGSSSVSSRKSRRRSFWIK
jgi:uncharacterized membrane protein YeaQ/YmgE (transglycosylase-associated protein family)